MIIKHQHYDLMKKKVLERIVLKPPFKADSSMHNEACFLYAINGRSKVYGTIAHKNMNAHEGVVLKCGNYLNTWLKNADDKPSEAIAVHFYPEVLKLVYNDKLPEFLLNKPNANPVIIEAVEINEMIRKYVESLVFYFENPSLINEELITLKVKELILLLINTDESNRIRNILQDLFNPIEYSFKEMIRAHLLEDLSLEDLALLSNLSISSFKRRFKEVFNDSPAHYIKTKRLEKAADLLVAGSVRISDLCFECGFNDIGHFSRSFTKHFGLSPKSYREQNAV